MDMIQNVLSGNVIIYAVLAGTLSFFRKYQPANNELKRIVLVLNNEIQRICTENEWKNAYTLHFAVCM
jgi:hypothetical protein